MIERYEIKGKVGEGGVGAVYKAYDNQLERVVAIKRLLPPELSEIDEAPDKLLAREANLMSSISHPNIIQVFDAGVDEDGAFVVMEFIDGETLEDTVSRGALTEDDFIRLAEQCLDGLIAAQSIGMLHRDIKPTNLMIRWLPTGRFEVKIVDFGLAKLTFKPTIQTIAHGDAILGSIYFLAPEQFERRPLDKRTDLYALGCVCYYALSQRYPFGGDNAAAVMMAHLEHRLAPLAELRPDLSPAIVDWVNQLIARDMENRPENAATAMAELATATEGRAGTLHPVVPLATDAASTSTPIDAEPDIPFAEPDIPFAEPDIPFAEPDIPFAEPDIPFAEPVIPFAEPDIPTAEPVIPIVAQAPESAVKPAVSNASDSRLITSGRGSHSRKLITSATSSQSTHGFGSSHKPPTTTSRHQQIPAEDHSKPMRTFMIILACTVPVVALILFLVLRSR